MDSNSNWLRSKRNRPIIIYYFSHNYDWSISTPTPYPLLLLPIVDYALDFYNFIWKTCETYGRLYETFIQIK